VQHGRPLAENAASDQSERQAVHPAAHGDADWGCGAQHVGQCGYCSDGDRLWLHVADYAPTGAGDRYRGVQNPRPQQAIRQHRTDVLVDEWRDVMRQAEQVSPPLKGRFAPPRYRPPPHSSNVT
jgi:hypothetical protein